MKFTKGWLDIHLKSKKKESQIIDKLNNIGLEVEKIEPIKNELSDFIIAKIIKADKHPNADRLKLCEVDIGENKIVKVVCGAPNAKDGLLTIYAPPGSVIPKNGMKLEVSKIRGETSYGMLCSEFELKLSNESEGIIELNSKNDNKIGKPYFGNSNKDNVIELSITPNRPDCLGVRGIARDLAACDFGDLKELKKTKLNKKIKHNFKVKIEKDKNQACYVFGSCIIRNINNTESPGWLKNRILALGLRPISAVVDITNYVMFDLNRPLHAYDLDKIKNRIIVRNSKKGEILTALDNNNYTLGENMCVIADDEGPLGLGGIIGGTRSGTEMDTKNILIESAYFDPELTRKTAKNLDLNSDAKFRFERGIDPNSIESGLEAAADLVTSICGGEVSKFDIQQNKKFKSLEINFDPGIVTKTIGIKVKSNQILKILTKLASASSTTTFTNKTFDADGTGNSITNIENADIKSAAAIDASKIANGNVSSAEFQYLDGVTSAIQTQIDAKTTLAAVYPVGSIYINATNSTNPATLLGFGTWAAFGAGRVMVGLNSGDTDFDTAEETGGAKTHTLTTNEMPSHTHGGIYPSGSRGSFTEAFDVDNPQDGFDKGNEKFTTSTGGGAAHNNLQPYIVVYMWKRTA